VASGNFVPAPSTRFHGHGYATVPATGELAASGLVVLGDKGYLGEDDIRTPYRGRNKPAAQEDANRAHARFRSPGERANAQLKSWRILRKLRCCPWRAGQLAKAIRVLHAREIAA
jgi:DDE superfamily endonuclease